MKQRTFKDTIVFVVFVLYRWMYGIPLRVVRIPSHTPLEKTSFLFVSDY